MFGFYRFLLALMVVANHLGGVTTIGGYAVFGFYILSGYLMTLIMHENYGYSLVGRGRYALNRFLRIFPIYWVACLLTLALILLFGGTEVRDYHRFIYLPADIGDWLRNLLILFTFDSEPRLTPPAWALTVELFYYILIGAGLSKSRRLTLLWFAVSLVYTGYVNLAGLPWAYRYFMIPAASLPFATGALIFHYRERVAAIRLSEKALWLPFAMFVVIALNYVVAYEGGWLRSYGFYVNYLLNAVMVALLLRIRELPLISRRRDRWLGDFSYPVYLIHWQTGLILVAAGVPWPVGERTFLLLSLPLVLLMAWLLTRSVELPVEHLRDRVRASG